MEYIRIKVIPKSSKNQIVDIIEEETEFGPQKTIKVKLRAVPEKGKANKALIEFLSDSLNVSKSQISILSGASSQIKLLKIDSPDTLNKIKSLLSTNE